MKSTILLFFIAIATATVAQQTHSEPMPTTSSVDDDDEFTKSLYELDNLVSQEDLDQALQVTRNTPPPSRATILVRQFGIALLLGCIAIKETLQEKFYRIQRYCYDNK